MDRPRRTSLLILFLVFLALLGGVVAAGSYYEHCKGADDGPTRDVSFEVPEGASAQQVVNDLHTAGVVRCGGFVGSLLMRGTGKSDRIRAGSYALTTGLTLDQAVEILTTPPPKVPTVSFTVPEGYRLTQIAERAQSDLDVSGPKLLSLSESGRYSLPPYLPAGTPTAEGFLFPKTYEFVRKTVAPDEVIREMLAQFRREAEGLPWEKAKGLGLTPYEVVIVASMIEEEAGVAPDRAKIAGVIYNRIDKGMTLGIDATLLYDDPTPDGELSSSDLEYDSPYNTRINAGLPPTPIASPGLASLLAALEPEDVPFFYYVLCGQDGSHRFAVTYGEHLRNVDTCL